MSIDVQQKITKTDLLVIPFYAEKTPTAQQQAALEQYGHPDFEAKPNETLMLYQKNKLTPRILLVGLGKQKSDSTEVWRQAGGTLAKKFSKAIRHLTVLPPKEDAACLAAFLEGMMMSHYRYEAFITDPERRLSPFPEVRWILQEKNTVDFTKKVNEVHVTTEAIKMVRDMVNAPSNQMSPSKIAEHATRVARGNFKTRCTIFGESKLIKLKMGCLVGVGKGAMEETKFIVLEYKNKPKNKRPIVLAGKGICFDAGGLNIKTSNMEEMKYDMTGAATVIALFKILNELKPNLHVIGLAPCAENLVGEAATKPGDILTSYDGTTVEITNTDAEGRLVLADAIGYAVKNYKPEAIIDIATLTGAAIIALGFDITALMTNNAPLAEKVKTAAKAVDEKVWELPLEEEYKKYMKSPIADLANFSPKASAGTIMGGAFLEHFTKNTPWVHLDMGGSAWTKEEKPYFPVGATGRMVRTLWKFLENYSS